MTDSSQKSSKSEFQELTGSVLNQELEHLQAMPEYKVVTDFLVSKGIKLNPTTQGIQILKVPELDGQNLIRLTLNYPPSDSSQEARLIYRRGPSSETIALWMDEDSSKGTAKGYVVNHEVQLASSLKRDGNALHYEFMGALEGQQPITLRIPNVTPNDRPEALSSCIVCTSICVPLSAAARAGTLGFLECAAICVTTALLEAACIPICEEVLGILLNGGAIADCQTFCVEKGFCP